MRMSATWRAWADADPAPRMRPRSLPLPASTCGARRGRGAVESLSGSPGRRRFLLWLGLPALGKGGCRRRAKIVRARGARLSRYREAEQANYLLAVIFDAGNRQAAARAYRRVLDTSSDEYLRERAERALRRIPPAQ